MVDLLQHSKILMEYAEKNEPEEARYAYLAVNPAHDLNKLSVKSQTLMRVGISPLSFPKSSIDSPYRHEWGCHPVMLAAAIQDHDPALAEALVERATEDAEIGKEGKYANHGNEATPPSPTPEPPKISARVRKTPTDKSFRPQLSAWYVPEVFGPVVEYHFASWTIALFVNRMHRAIGDTPHGQRCLRDLTTKFMLRTLSERAKPGVYDSLARIVRYAHREKIVEAIKGKNNVYQFLYAFLENPSSVEMVQGLSWLAESWPSGLAYLPRAPTLEELRKLRGAKNEVILNALPWEILEVLLNEDVSAVRGLLIGFSDLETARRCLENRKDRPTWERSYTTGDEAKEWQPYKEKITEGYVRLRQYREAVELLDVPPIAAAHLLHAKWSELERHATALEWLERYPELEPLWRACPRPWKLSQGSNGTYRWIETST